MSEGADPPGEADGIPVRWRRWAAVALMRGTPVTEVLNVLDAEGFGARDAVLLCASLYESPAMDGGRWLAGQLAKMTSVLMMREKVAGPPADLERRSGVSRDEFLDRYYARNEPVVLTDVCDDWPARSLWSPEYLAEVLGPLESLDLAAETAAPLREDFTLDERYLKPEPEPGATLRLGAAGSVTPLRHELKNMLSCQVDGWQHVIMIPALQIHRVYNSVNVFSDVDPLAPDHARYPLFADATQLHLDLGRAGAVHPGGLVASRRVHRAEHRHQLHELRVPQRLPVGEPRVQALRVRGVKLDETRRLRAGRVFIAT